MFNCPHQYTLVAASGEDGDLRTDSNHGNQIDILGTGENVRSAWSGAHDAYETRSGTSAACPVVAGIMALVLSDLEVTPTEVKRLLRDTAASRGGHPNCCSLYPSTVP